MSINISLPPFLRGVILCLQNAYYVTERLASM